MEVRRLNEADVGPVAKDVPGNDVEGLYRLTVTSKEDDKVHRGSVVACLGKLDGRMFLDVFPDKFPSGEQDIEKLPLVYNVFFFVPVHTFIQVDRTGDQLKLRLTDEERLAKLLEAEPAAVKHEEALDDRRVLTASTKELADLRPQARRRRLLLRRPDDPDPQGQVTGRDGCLHTRGSRQACIALRPSWACAGRARAIRPRICSTRSRNVGSPRGWPVRSCCRHPGPPPASRHATKVSPNQIERRCVIRTLWLSPASSVLCPQTPGSSRLRPMA